jgi:hypothetical protein
METAEVEYGGYVIKQPSGPKDASECWVYVQSENPHLLSRLLAAIMHHASRFCPPGRRTHAVDPSVWIGVSQLAAQRIGD